MGIDTSGFKDDIWIPDPATFSEKYRHLGISYPSVPKGWVVPVMNCLKEIEKEMWPQWMPFWMKRFIHYQATGNSVVCVKSNFWYKIRNYFTGGMIIFQIKDKFSTLRIYGSFNDKIYKIIEDCEEVCLKSCEVCGSQREVELENEGWMTRYCEQCKNQR